MALDELAKKPERLHTDGAVRFENQKSVKSVKLMYHTKGQKNGQLT